MGTRAVYGFRKNNKYKVTFRSSDGYLTGLGLEVIDFIKNTPYEEIVQIYNKIKLVSPDRLPTEEELDLYYKWRNEYNYNHAKNVGKYPVTWMSLLNLFDGKVNRYKQGLDVMMNDERYMKEGTDWEFKYIINLDKKQLKIHNQSPDGRCERKLIIKYDLDNIPEEYENEFKKLNKKIMGYE